MNRQNCLKDTVLQICQMMRILVWSWMAKEDNIILMLVFLQVSAKTQIGDINVFEYNLKPVDFYKRFGIKKCLKKLKAIS